MIRSGLKTFRTARMYLGTIGMAGSINALGARLSGSGKLYRMRRPDCLHPFFLRPLSSDVPTCQQVFAFGEYDFKVKRQPKVIVDAGANIGLASIYFANKYPEATILAIEPEGSNFELLKRNVAPYPRIQPIQAALWDRNEEISLVDPGLGNWGFMTESAKAGEESHGASRHMVRAMTVDRILEEHGFDRIDILKIDIEGAEKEVFADSGKWISKVDSIIIELHERLKPGCNRSFYKGSEGFDDEWKLGENVYLSRAGFLEKT